MYKFENWTWCRCWLPLLGAIAGLPLLGIAGGGGCTRWRIGRGAVAGCHCWAAIAGCHWWVPLLGMGGVGLCIRGTFYSTVNRPSPKDSAVRIWKLFSDAPNKKRPYRHQSFLFC